ncbi:MAG: hypothetical protein KJ052_04775 [Candidatus Hydrogenedentes bacterium]|nr:hypothetical protein [Candidatus Hydrogenedentota bacterium]
MIRLDLSAQPAVPLDPSIEKHIGQLTDFSRAKTPLEISAIQDLYSEDEDFWQGVALGLKTDWRVYDLLLRKLHYKRDSSYTTNERSSIMRFLTMAYLITRDVRYFNEWLFFANDEVTRDAGLMRSVFSRNLDENGHHVFPLATPDLVRDSIKQVHETVRSAPHSKSAAPLRIGLLGTPSSYTNAYRVIQMQGHDPEIVFFSYDKDTKRRFIKSNRLLAKLIFLLKGCRLPYTVISESYGSPAITQQLNDLHLNLGFQRVAFIVKNNIIKCFPSGLLNSHLAILPYVRGRSSIEFSLLFGFPVGATVHYVDEGVDTGEILKTFAYEPSELSSRTISGIRREIDMRADDWILETLSYVSNYKAVPIANPLEKGLQYFTMHPSLVNYIDANLFVTRPSEGS